jgi:hypothetical protein|nr:MAG TPA: hypothetical protein [Crassvirales sp.]
MFNTDYIADFAILVILLAYPIDRYVFNKVPLAENYYILLQL